MAIRVPTKRLDIARDVILQTAQYHFAASYSARIGDPVTRSIRNDADSRPNAVFVHGLGENAQEVQTAIAQIPIKDLLYGMPVRVKNAVNGAVIVSLDENESGIYLEGAEASQDSVPVYLSQLFYGTLHPEPTSGTMRVFCIGAMFGDTFLDDRFTADFSTSPLDTSGAAINIPSTANTCIMVLIQIATSGVLSYKQSASMSAEATFIQAYNESLLPIADYDKYRLGYVKLTNGISVIDYYKLWSVPELLNKSIIPSNVGAYATKTANYTIAATDETIIADASSNTVTITLPLASTVAGQAFNVKVKNVSYAITLATTSGEAIDFSGATSIALTTVGDNCRIKSIGTQWIIL